MFAYGPLGFLETPQAFYGTTTILATIACAAIYVGLAAALVHLGRRLLPLWAAAIVALVVCRALFPLLKPPEALQALIFAGCVEAVLWRGADAAHGRRVDLVIAGAGVVAAVALLGKANVGAFTFALLLVTAMCVARPFWRGAAVFLGATALAGLVLFLATGQSISGIPAFVSGIVEVVRGYSEAMVVETPPAHAWYYLVFAEGLAILVAIGWAAARGAGRRRTIALIVVGAVLAFGEWKTAFTRNGVSYAFATGVVAMFALGSRLPPTMPLRRPIVAVAVAALLVPALVVGMVRPLSILDVRASVRNVAGTALAFLPWRQDAARERTSAQLRALLDVPDDAVAALTGQSVHVEQWETTVMAAYPEFRWAPLPTIQAYAAYTTVLDELNANVLRSADAPTRILRERLLRPDGQPPRGRPPLPMVRGAGRDARDAVPLPRAHRRRPLAGAGSYRRLVRRRQALRNHHGAGRGAGGRPCIARSERVRDRPDQRLSRQPRHQGQDGPVPGRRVVHRAGRSRPFPVRSGDGRRRPDPRRPAGRRLRRAVRLRPADHVAEPDRGTRRATRATTS